MFLEQIDRMKSIKLCYLSRRCTHSFTMSISVDGVKLRKGYVDDTKEQNKR